MFKIQNFQGNDNSNAFKKETNDKLLVPPVNTPSGQLLVHGQETDTVSLRIPSKNDKQEIPRKPRGTKTLNDTIRDL